jgi:hypothetical protein
MGVSSGAARGVGVNPLILNAFCLGAGIDFRRRGALFDWLTLP